MAHAVYLTYEEYVSYGGTLPQSAFTMLEFRARKRIDYLTDSRVQDMENVPEAVKLCIMSLITVDNAAGIEAQAEHPVVTSFNTDGYSENYGKAMSTGDAEANMNSTIRTYLYGEYDDSGVPLLYRGVNGYEAV